jgi:leucyl aminopeptidase (aminopeptidase T)
MTSNTEAKVREGVANLIRNCVGVEKGESILLLNEQGVVDHSLVELMEEAVRAEGGSPFSLWVEPLAGVAEMPGVLGAAVLAADKLVMNANLNRVVLLEHLRANDKAGLVRINNRARAAEAFTSEHALFNWKLVMALAGKIEEVTSAANQWKITSPHGTDISGRVAKGSEVAGAFFAQDAEASRTERVFPGEVYAPVGSAGATGIIAFDHPGFSDKNLFVNPMMLTVEAGQVTNVEWREEPVREGQRDDATGNTVWTSEQLNGLLESNAEKFGREAAYALDSWHGGMHPRAVRKGGQQSNPDTMHFHIGNVPAARSAYVSDQTITLDGNPFWVEGRPALLEDQFIKDVAAEHGVTLD